MTTLTGAIATRYHLILRELLRTPSGLRFDQAYYASKDLIANEKDPRLTKAAVETFLDGRKDIPEYYKTKLLAVFDEFTDLSKVTYLKDEAAKKFYTDTNLVKKSYGLDEFSKLHEFAGIVTPTLAELVSKTADGQDYVTGMLTSNLERIAQTKLDAENLNPQIESAQTDVNTANKEFQSKLTARTSASEKLTSKQLEAIRAGKGLKDISTTAGFGILDKIFPKRVTERAELAKNFAAYQKATTQMEEAEKVLNKCVGRTRKLTEDQAGLNSTASHLRSNLPAFVRKLEQADGATPETIAAGIAEKGDALTAAITNRFNNPDQELTGKSAAELFATFREYLRMGDRNHFGGYSSEYGPAGNIFNETAAPRDTDNARISKFALDGYMTARDYPDYLRQQMNGLFDAATGNDPEKIAFTDKPARTILTDVAAILKHVKTKHTPETCCETLLGQTKMVVSQEFINLITHNAKGEPRFDDEVTQRINDVFERAAQNKEALIADCKDVQQFAAAR